VNAPKASTGPALHRTGKTIWDGVGGIRDDAPIADVVFELFNSIYADAGRESFVQAAARCTVDELAVLELAVYSENGGGLNEVPALLERMRHRLQIAQWLDVRVERSTSVAANDGGAS
jgi:hypothetical protein